MLLAPRSSISKLLAQSIEASHPHHAHEQPASRAANPCHFVLFRGDVATDERLPFALYSGTALPPVVAITNPLRTAEPLVVELLIGTVLTQREQGEVN